MSQKITPNLWFDGNAKDAADFYTSVFPNSSIAKTTYYPESESQGLADFQKDLAGKVLTVEYNLSGYEFLGINAGPEFEPNQSISFMINFDPLHDDQAREHLEETWNKLVDGGEAMMPLDKYPFSDYYGWVKDKYGFTWQLILTRPEGDPRPFIMPSLLFGANAQNRAKEALEYYSSIFTDSAVGGTSPYGQDIGPAKADSLAFGEFHVGSEWFVAMDSGVEQHANFNEAVSLSVSCKDQEEIDYLWSKLSAVPESEQCGWCKDKFGVSWQIVPENWEALISKPGAYAKMMSMKKLVIAEF